MPHQFFNSSRCGHVDMVIDPSAFKESVAVSGLVFPVWQNILAGVKGGALRAGSFFLTYESAQRRRVRRFEIRRNTRWRTVSRVK